jgi:hypothetical protein
MHPLEVEIQSIVEQSQMGNITAEDKEYLLNEIIQIRAAQECADNEVMFRHIVQACSLAVSVV